MGWGSSTRRGGGRKLRARPRNFVFLGFRREESGMSRELCRDVPTPGGVQKVCAKKLRAHFSFPNPFGNVPFTCAKLWLFLATDLAISVRLASV